MTFVFISIHYKSGFFCKIQSIVELRELLGHFPGLCYMTFSIGDSGVCGFGFFYCLGGFFVFKAMGKNI